MFCDRAPKAFTAIQRDITNWLLAKSLGVHRKAPHGAVVLPIRNDDTGIEDGTYCAAIFAYRGKAIFAAGCRTFTLDEAEVHWSAVLGALPSQRGNTSFLAGLRKDRAATMLLFVLPKAYRIANRRGWKL